MAVIGDLSVSLDGFATTDGADLEHGLGVGGEPIHAWAIDPTDVDREILKTATQATGAVVMGRKLFDFVDGPNGWSDEIGYGASEVGRPPIVVVTSSRPATLRLDLDVTFATDGIEAAVRRAQDAAGSRDVVVMGGAHVVRSCLDAGLLDRLVLHITPFIAGAGTPLFDDARRRQLRQTDVTASERAIHVTYAVT